MLIDDSSFNSVTTLQKRCYCICEMQRDLQAVRTYFGRRGQVEQSKVP